jgi:hypothetical protein
MTLLADDEDAPVRKGVAGHQQLDELVPDHAVAGDDERLPSTGGCHAPSEPAGDVEPVADASTARDGRRIVAASALCATGNAMFTRVSRAGAGHRWIIERQHRGNMASPHC